MTTQAKDDPSAPPPPAAPPAPPSPSPSFFSPVSLLLFAAESPPAGLAFESPALADELALAFALALASLAGGFDAEAPGCDSAAEALMAAYMA